MIQGTAIYNLSNNDEFVNILNNTCENNKYLKVLNNKNCDYKIVRYNKELLSFDLIENYGLFRSVVLNNDNKVVSFAPPKAIDADTFMKRHSISEPGLSIEEFVEGTMINVFCNNGVWEIATRSTIGGNASFYKSSNSKTFKEMFFEACLSANFGFQFLNPNYCYSFVLQHPSNRIVKQFTSPTLYLVEVYYIEQTGTNARVHVLSMDSIVASGCFNTTGIKFPQKITANSYSELIEKYASCNTSYDVMGVVLKNTLTGVRSKIRNPIYEEVRQLRGNQPKLQYQYLCLRSQGKVADYLKVYREHKEQFSTFRDQLHMYTDTLYKNYVSCYIRKEKPLNEFGQQYRTHMYNIHQHYMNELKPKQLHITNTEVINYVNKLHPSLLMYCLNFHFRKQSVDTLKADF